MDNTFQLVFKFLESEDCDCSQITLLHEWPSFLAFPCLYLWRFKRLSNSSVRYIYIQFVFEEMEVQNING